MLKIKKVRKYKLQSKVEGRDTASARGMGQAAGLELKMQWGSAAQLGEAEIITMFSCEAGLPKG